MDGSVCRGRDVDLGAKPKGPADETARLIFTSMFWGICALLACVTASRAVAEDLPKSRQETTERVLKPFLDQLAALRRPAVREVERRQYRIDPGADSFAAGVEEGLRRRQAKEDEDFGNRIRATRLSRSAGGCAEADRRAAAAGRRGTGGRPRAATPSAARGCRRGRQDRGRARRREDCC